MRFPPRYYSPIVEIMDNRHEIRPPNQNSISRILPSRNITNYQAIVVDDIESQRTRPGGDESAGTALNDCLSAIQRYVAISFILMFLVTLSLIILGSFLLLLSLLAYLLIGLPSKVTSYPLQLILLYWFFITMFSFYVLAFVMFLLFAYRHIVYYLIYFTLEL
jgi:hypothetical protein